MTRISKHKLKEQVLKKLFTLFFTAVGKKKAEHDFLSVIEDLLSPTERVMIAKRVAIVYLCSRAIDYVTIANTLKVAPATIARYARVTKKASGLTRALRHLLRVDKTATLLDELLDFLVPPGTPGANWSAAWERKRRILRRKYQPLS